MRALLTSTIAAITLFALLGFVSESKEKGQIPAYYGCGDGQPIDKSLFELKENEVYFVFDQQTFPDTSEIRYMDWFGLHDDNYFTAYLVNTTNKEFEATRQDGSLMMIQEAKNRKGEWEPIEFWIPSGCGNSYFNPLVLQPNEFAKVAIVQYAGSFKTELRLKFKYSDKVMYSQPFDGSINISQFRVAKEDVNGILYYGPARYLDEE